MYRATIYIKHCSSFVDLHDGVASGHWDIQLWAEHQEDLRSGHLLAQ